MAATDFSIADVLAWARTKPADEAYDYHDICGCALYQFCEAKGLPVASCGGTDWCDHKGNRHRLLPQGCGVASSGPWTFGAFVKRLEALAPETVVTRSDWTRLDAYLTDIEQVEA